ncbi:hypothetical protein GGR57DRAFT_35736 [Xylariaceae sp. FL1272]|nr:hypothetical protein GGR57DRAFT_35736 [Xylariaceae sp. FL1272]
MRYTLALALIASITSMVAASPAADAAQQLAGREPVICVGCVNTNGCNVDLPDGCDINTPGSCTSFCISVADGCKCCDINPDNSVDNDSCHFR